MYLFIKDYQTDHDTPQQFAKALFYWKNAPAYVVVPTDPAASPKDALMMDDDSSYDDEMASKDDDTSETSDN